jgi:hypothetical protein
MNCILIKQRATGAIFLILICGVMLQGKLLMANTLTVRDPLEKQMMGSYELLPKLDLKIKRENDGSAKIFIQWEEKIVSSIFEIKPSEFIEKLYVSDAQDAVVLLVSCTYSLGGSNYCGLIYFRSESKRRDDFKYEVRWLLPAQPSPEERWFMITDFRKNEFKSSPFIDLKVHMLQEDGKFVSIWKTLDLDTISSPRNHLSKTE